MRQKPFRVIGIAGAAGAGKDTAARYLAMEYDFVVHHFSDPIKRALNAMFGWEMLYWDDREWKERVQSDIGKSPRQLAQTLGTEWGRNQVHRDLWITLAKHARDNARLNGRPGIIFADCRFENEALLARENCGFVVHITRPGVEAVSAHSSETPLPSELVDLRILNDGSVAKMFNALDDFIKALDQ